ncbi:MAG: nuclear transport factor 2 family protein [Luteimonas sp.]
MAAYVMGACILLAACTRTPHEQALREAVSGVQAALEARDASTLQAYLADDFIGPEGLDRRGARRMATLYLMRHDRIGVTLGSLDVTMQGSHARVRCTAALTGGSGRLLPESGRVYALETGWRLDDGEWKLTSATWKPQL